MRSLHCRLLRRVSRPERRHVHGRLQCWHLLRRRHACDSGDVHFLCRGLYDQYSCCHRRRELHRLRRGQILYSEHTCVRSLHRGLLRRVSRPERRHVHGRLQCRHLLRRRDGCDGGDVHFLCRGLLHGDRCHWRHKLHHLCGRKILNDERTHECLQRLVQRRHLLRRRHTCDGGDVHCLQRGLYD